MKSILCLVSILFSLLSSGEEIAISVGNYPPYLDESKENMGFMSEIVFQAFSKTKLVPVVEFKPWKRIEEIEITKNNKVSFGWIKTQQRQAKWLYSDNIMRSSIVFITNKNNGFTWQSLSDLKPFHIGVSRGYQYGNEFEAYKHQLKIQEVNSDEQNIRKLVMGRIELFPVDPYVSTEIIRNSLSLKEASQLRLILEPALVDETMHLVCAKTNNQCEEILDNFNQGLATIKDNGVLKSILDRAIIAN
jgi:polar amino acid transport system substrate-binding protein